MKQQLNQNQIQINHTARNYILISLVILLIGVIAFTIFTFLTPKKTSVCGNNVCDASENCYDCPQDCKCGSPNSYCSSTQKKCITSQCGNGVCEPFESMQNCCEDCGCSSAYQTCNKTTHMCEIPAANISDDRVKELATQYYANKNETISEFGIISSTVYHNVSAKSIGIKILGDLKVHILYVTVDEQIYEKILQ